MEELIKQKAPPLDLEACNHCKMYLRVLWVSDIATGDGTLITDDAWNGILSTSDHIEQTWPQCGRPPACPHYGDKEDAPHVWTCRAKGAEEVWKKSVGELEVCLRQIDTDPTITHVIITYLNKDTSYVPPRELQELLQEQNHIGWRRFFEGWISMRWAIKQQRYYEASRSRQTGRRWVTVLIQKLWDIAWDLWEHRNGIVHEQENLVTRSMGTLLNHRVDQVYEGISSRPVPVYDRHLVHMPLSKLLNKSVSYKVHWLEVAEPVLQEGRRQSWQRKISMAHMLTGMKRCVFSWLKR